MRGAILMGLVCAFAGTLGCGNPGTQVPAQKPQAAVPAIPPEIDSAARGALGQEAEALAWGDLALNGQRQILVINRLNGPSMRAVPGAVLTRLAVLENDGGKWKEVLLCDEHLKNMSGFLGGAPIAAVSSWRLQFEKDPKQGLLLFLSPFKQGPDVRTQAIEIRWNPAVRRYQAMDENHEQFVGETPALEDIHRTLQ